VAARAIGSEREHDDSGPVSSVGAETNDDKATGDYVAAGVTDTLASAASGHLSTLQSEDGDPDDLGDGDDDPPPSKEEEWEIFRVVAAVQLKLHAACPRPFKTLQQGAVNEDEIKLDSDHSSLAQALLYALGVVLWDRAGLGLDLPESLPVAVVAVRRVSNPKVLLVQKEIELGALPRNATRWLHGNLLIPEQCGGLFSYNVDAFGMFAESTGASALAAYLDVMAEGLRAAVRWLKLVEGLGCMPPARSMTGRTLCFPGQGDDDDDDVLTTFTHVSSPVAPSSDAHFRISQGELFQWTLDLKALYRDTRTKRSDPVYWCSDDGHDLPDQTSTVLVKVTSKACYGLVTDGQGFLYQMRAYKKGRNPEVVRQVFHLLKDSLYAVYVPFEGAGTVQIMPDLRRAMYQKLRPSGQWHTAEAWTAAWTAVKNLVRDVLIPLAEADLIHVDLRPGFDATANILYCQSTSKMVLIDVDSLVTFDAWQKLCSRPVGSNLISARLNSVYPKSPLEYVLWQAICLAETWISGTTHNDVQVRPIIDSKRDHVDSLLAKSSLSLCDRAVIEGELKRYDKYFGGVGAADRAASSVRATEASVATASSSRLPRQAGAAIPAPVTETNPRRGDTTTWRKRQFPRT
jgi:hypothetical protein